MLLVASLATFAHEFEVDGIYYDKFSSSTCAVTYKGPNFLSAAYSGNVTIPSQVTSEGITYSVTKIGEGAFNNCTGLTSITIPESVMRIGGNAFNGCANIDSISLPNSVTSIGDGAFFKCTGLTSITIPNSVTSIGFGAFQNCSGLTDVTCLATTPPTVYSDTFSHYGTLHVLPGCKAAYEATAVWNEFTIVEDATDGIEGITADAHAADARKFLQNGRILIRKAGKTFNAAGVEL